MSKFTKKLSLSSLLFSLCMPLTSCYDSFKGLPDSGWEYDLNQYVNYEKIYHIKEKDEKDYYDIDFLNDVFPNGILIDQEGKRHILKDEYDGVCIDTFQPHSLPHWHPNSFKVRYRRSSSSNDIYFSFVNSKTHKLSDWMHLGKIFEQDEINNPVHIRSIDDFKKIESETNLIYLDNDIDFNNYVFNEDSDRLFGRSFCGVFLNPEKHVLKNIVYEASKIKYHSFLFHTITGSWFDSLIIDNFRYINKNDVKGNEFTSFAVIANNCSYSYFSNCKITNFTVEANDLYAAPFINFCRNVDFYNCEVSGNINNRYEPIPTTSFSGNNGLGLYGRTAGFCNTYVATEVNAHYRVRDSINAYICNQTEESRIQLFSEINTLPVQSFFINNRIMVNVSGKGKSGGIFTTADRTNQFFTNNIFVGNIEGKYTGEISFDNYYCEIDNLGKSF